MDLMDSMKPSIDNYICKEMVLCKGIGIGLSRKKKEELCTSSLKYVSKYWANVGLITNINRGNLSTIVTPLQSIVWKEEVYRPGDHVVVLMDECDDAYNPLTWKVVLQHFFMHEFMGNMQFFFEAH